MTEKIVYHENPTSFNAVFKSPAGPVGKDMLKKGRKLQSLARRQVGHKTGVLAATLTVTMSKWASGDIKITVGSSSKVAYMHHEGTRAHVILPRRTSALRFTQGGRVVYARRVYHPGTRPNRYLTDNLPRVVLT